MGVDWSGVMRASPTIREYVLIGETVSTKKDKSTLITKHDPPPKHALLINIHENHVCTNQIYVEIQILKPTTSK